MKKCEYHILGVMSGTSLDGIDLAYLKFEFHKKWKFTIESTETVPYTQVWQKKLKNVIHCTSSELENLNLDYTLYLAEVISDFIINNQIKKLDAVCSHGHTIKHEPHKGVTLQIGNLPLLATKINKKVVCDFRVEDVELGGQGAPLVPIGDELLFSQYDFCLNLGGFANISTRQSGNRIAYDICAVNTVLNYYSLQAGKSFDESGNLAKSGKLNEELLNELNSLEYYFRKAPKSLGIEWVEKNIFPIIESYKISNQDKLHTYCIHAAIQISNCFLSENGQVLVTGGGSFNTFLIDEISKRSQLQLILPDNNLINYKEALIFGFLGVLKIRKENNVLASVTGASRNHSSGKIYLP